MEIFLFYSFSYIVALLSGPSLAILGHHQILRGRILEIFALSQLALLGNLISHLFDSHIPGLGAGMSCVFYAFGKWCFIKKQLSKGPIYKEIMMGLYLLFLSTQYLIIGLFPKLDTHMSVGLFGSMVTATFWQNAFLASIFVLFLSIYFLNRKEISRNSLEQNLLKGKGRNWDELIVFSTLLITSLFGLGLLYTLGFMLLPHLILGKQFKNQRVANIVILFLAGLSSLGGLLLSIFFEGLSTTPIQIVLIVGLSLFVRWGLFLRSPLKTPDLFMHGDLEVSSID